MRTSLLGAAVIGAILLASPSASAADIYVLEAVHENTAKRWGTATTSLVKDAVTKDGDHSLIGNESAADFVLQPKLLGLGEEYILTIEKRRGPNVVLANQVRLSSLDELDQAAARATREVLDGTANVVSATTLPATTIDKWDRDATPVYHFWTAGIGPFGGNNLDTENILYSISLGHTWDIHPRVAIRGLGEAAFSTGDEDANFFNLAFGPSYYFTGGNNEQSPYANLDFGYGFGQANNNEDIDGFSLGLGVGYRFFRTASTGMEINVRWATIFDPVVGEDNPHIIGARLGVDF